MLAGTNAATQDVPGASFRSARKLAPRDGIADAGTAWTLPVAVGADMPTFGDVTTQAGGVAGTLAGTILTFARCNDADRWRRRYYGNWTIRLRNSS